MKIFTITFLLLFSLTGITYAQVRDTHPTAVIYLFDPQSGQEEPAMDDDAVIFKNTLIDIVANTNAARSTIKLVPGRKSFVITQADPKDGYAYQIVYQSVFLKQVTPLYTFMYDAEQNALAYVSPQTGGYIPVNVDGAALANLQSLSQFNAPNTGQPVAAADQQVDNTPVDQNVTTATVPPPLPDYEQPECPQDGYLWQPGYWAYSPQSAGYYWVPGAWVAPPDAGLLWTPPYWGFVGGIYAFHGGYWGPTIGFYGGINYGYGYGGVGFYGGEWRGGRFAYNTAVMRVNVTVVHNTYVNRTVIVNHNDNHYSFNGRGGVAARPTPTEMAAMHEQHTAATPEQIRNQRMARTDEGHSAAAISSGRATNLAVAKVPAQAPVTRNDNRNPGNNNPGNGRNANTTPGGAGNGGNANSRFGNNAPAANGVNNATPNAARNNANAPGGARPPVPTGPRPNSQQGGGRGYNNGGNRNNNRQPAKDNSPKKKN